MKRLLRDLLRSSFVQRALGVLAAEYLRLVWLTNRFVYEPPDVYGIVEPMMPAIFVFWHGQHLMTPFIRTKDSYKAKVLISRHRDGEFNAIAVERLGIGTIRGSGDHSGAFHRKGGVGAFKEMGRALEEGWNVATTADVPKRARVAGLGAIMLARETGRPILALAMVTSRFIRLKNWDSTTINLPFGRGAVVGIEPVHVPPDADAETMEKLRQHVEYLLNEATRRAYAAVGRPEATLG
ncbi:lysophospholipid acyltransferase family protein [Bradyrhizobium jicamae]|uniref:Lysophospholipid acyltransferase family protein n=1 Tax=Bradyrhizobium jicamae TaxID=280332 RepID=A0ABS5FD71_9BRAD|nr:lysophospholipid acyltransferase family protein [Bradyrhizobium jicamae]MBR0794634.1 lysophospholipid acyltransferase family protein [Bradyrhizobium jicamae]MBR0932915.1 lysophospholipid acyltransferase family protein [Bradyrhizobium jicamae]